MRPAGLGPALGEVLDEQGPAALVAEFPDLPQQLPDRDPGFFGAALAQVIAVRAGERGPVLPSPLQPPGLVSARVPPDRLDGQVQAAGAFPQPGAFAEQVVDLLPALQGRLGALSGLRLAGLGPAGAVRRDFPLHGLGQPVPQVPAITDLDRAGQCAADRF